MDEVADILARVRAAGCNLSITAKGLRIVNRAKLPADLLAAVKKHANALAGLVQRETEDDVAERASIIEFDGKAPREWAEQFAHLLYARRPAGVSDLDWSWFITTCGRMIDEAPPRSDVP